MKKCGRCKELKDLSEFHSNPTKKDGVQSMCKVCRKEYHREHYLKNRQKYIDNSRRNKRKLWDILQRLKSMKGCSKCNDKRYYVLDFHHLKDKEFNITYEIKRSGIGMEKLKKEINKCIIVCSNCHRELHYLEKSRIGVSD